MLNHQWKYHVKPKILRSVLSFRMSTSKPLTIINHKNNTNMQKAKMHNLKEKNGSWFKVTDPVIMETKKMHKQYRFCKSNTPNVIFYSLTRGYHRSLFHVEIYPLWRSLRHSPINGSNSIISFFCAPDSLQLKSNYRLAQSQSNNLR